MNTTAVNSKNQTENAKKGNEKVADTKVNNMPVSREFDAPKKEEVKKPEPAKEQPEAKKPEPVKQPVKPALNLDNVIKLIEELNRKKIQRDRLLYTIETLEAFEVELRDEAEGTDSNYYQGCLLTIKDDNRNEFSTKNPFIIQAVARYVKKTCLERLEEIEADILLPY